MPTRRHPEQAAEWNAETYAAWVLFLILTPDEEFGDLHEVVGQDGDADKD